MKKTNQAWQGDGASRKRMLLASLVIHAVILGSFPILVALLEGEEEPEKIEVVFYKRVPEPLQPPVPEPEPEPEPQPEVILTDDIPDPRPTPEPVQLAQAAPPEPEPPAPRQEPRRPEPAPEPKQVARALPPPPPPERKPAPRKRPPVRTNVFGSDAEPVARTRDAAPKSTRPAGFGDAEPDATPARAQSRFRGGARVGSFEVAPPPAGEPVSGKPRRAVAAATSFGDAATPESNKRPSPAQVARVQATSFGDAGDAAPATSRRPGSGSGTVRTGGFGGPATASEQPRRARKKSNPSPDTPVEILSKVKPAYTDEARELQVEGEVVLNVIFDASGKMRVIGVVEGLGHGLDESAMAAARKIEFKPARRDGQPVDHAATLRIVFQLA